MSEQDDKLRELVADVTAAYFSNSHVAPAEIPSVVNQIAASLSAVGAPAAAEPAAEAPSTPRLTPAQIRKSITPEAIISFEDGKRYKTLRRHLATRGLTPAQYKEKWGLPGDYPLVAESYSATRSALAKQLGLGNLGRNARPAASAAPKARAKAATPRKPRAAKA